MADTIKRLGDAELEIMMVLWEAENPVTASYILEHIKDKRNWALSTLMTILARLGDKGFVYCDRSTRTNYYTAQIREREYKAKESSSFLEKVFGNSVQSLVVSLYDSKAINREDLNALRDMIDRIGEGGQDDSD